MDDLHRMGRWIRTARTRAGLSQEALAARVPMTKNQLSRIERGLVSNGPHGSTLRGIETALGVEHGTLAAVSAGNDEPSDAIADLRRRVAALEATIATLSQPSGR